MNARTKPKRKTRRRPGSMGKGKYYHIDVRPKNQFVFFTTHDVGEPGGLQRIAGRRENGRWATVGWLVSKEDARMDKNNNLVIFDASARTVLKSLRGPIEHVQGDIFKAKPRKNVPEKDKPTEAQLRAWRANIKKAHAARRKK